MQHAHAVLKDKFKFDAIMQNHSFIPSFINENILGSELITIYKDEPIEFDSINYTIFVAAFLASTNYDVEAYSGQYVDSIELAKKAHIFLLRNISVKEVVDLLGDVKLAHKVMKNETHEINEQMQFILTKFRPIIEPIHDISLFSHDEILEVLISKNIPVNLIHVAIFHNLYFLSKFILELAMGTKSDCELIDKASLYIDDINQIFDLVNELNKTSLPA